MELLSSVTLEEAPVSKRVVDRQQRRWKGGYLQTGLVHTRRPFSSARRMGPHRWLCFNVLMLGTPFVFLVNPIFIGLFIAYFATRSTFITDLFPTPVYYTATALLMIGNFGVVYELVDVCLEESHQARGKLGLVKYMFAAQILWLWMSRSTYIAVFELLTGRRGWHKTPHGHDEPNDDVELPRPPVQPAAKPRQPTSPVGHALVGPVPHQVPSDVATALLPCVGPDTA